MTQVISDNGVTYGNTAAAHALYSIGASVAGNALTITLDPCVLAFRSSSLTSGTPSVVTSNTQLSLTIPSGATLGTINGQQARLVVFVMNQAGVPYLGVANIQSPYLDETTLQSALAISTGSVSATAMYATAAVSGAFKLVGYIDITQATAGVWASAPTVVQGQGGQALSAMSSLGYGQTWQSVTRTSGTTYYNTTGKPIYGKFNTQISAGTGTTTLSINGVSLGNAIVSWVSAGTVECVSQYLIPVGSSYVFTDGGSTTSRTSYELR